MQQGMKLVKANITYESPKSNASEKEKAFANEKIEFLYNKNSLEIIGDKTVNGLVIQDSLSQEIETLEVDGVFPFIGLSPNINYINGQLKQDSNGFIITNELMQTSVEGVYAVGDIRTTPLRQVITAVSDGAIAAVNALKYVESLEYVTNK